MLGLRPCEKGDITKWVCNAPGRGHVDRPDGTQTPRDPRRGAAAGRGGPIESATALESVMGTLLFNITDERRGHASCTYCVEVV